MPAHDHFDIAIIGAGAAGLAAAATLGGRPLDVAVLEARDRLGGRAHTLRPGGLFPLDAGCGWLHSADRNALAPLIEAAGFAIDRTRPHWERQSANKGFSAAPTSGRSTRPTAPSRRGWRRRRGPASTVPPPPGSSPAAAGIR